MMNLLFAARFFRAQLFLYFVLSNLLGSFTFMTLFSSFCCVAFLWAGAFLQSLSAQSHASLDESLPTYRESIKYYQPMSLQGLEPRLTWILENYYQAAFGGEENWRKIRSLRFEGVLRLSTGTLSFVAFKKKPDYCKIVLFAGNGARIVMAFDGTDAWQLDTMEASEPIPMPPIEALNFIRDAPAAGHLLYPNLPGKQIELLGQRTVNGNACLDLRVTLADGQQVTYAIDNNEFIERQQRVVNMVSGDLEVTTHEQVKKVAGVTVALHSKMTVDGELLHEVHMQRVEANLGLMSWMFTRPSGAYVTGKLPDGVDEQSLRLSMEESSYLEPEWGMPAISFGDSTALGVFGATRFPDLNEAAKRSILENIGEF